MGKPRKHPHEYRVFREDGTGDSLVVVEYDSHPGWFRLVGTFPFYDRAADYAEFENQMTRDWPDEDDRLESRDDVNDGPPDDLPPSPKSGIKKAAQHLAAAGGSDVTDKPRDDHRQADPPPAAEPGQAEQRSNSPAEASGGDSPGSSGAPLAEIRGLPREESSGTAREAPGTRGEQDASGEDPVGVQPEAPNVQPPGATEDGAGRDMPREGRPSDIPAPPDPGPDQDRGLDDSASAAADPVECQPAAQHSVTLDDPVERVLRAITELDRAEAKISYTTVVQHSGLPLRAVGDALTVLVDRGAVAIVQPSDPTELRTRGGIRLVKPEPEILPPSRLDETPRADAQGGVVPPPLEQVPDDDRGQPDAPEVDLTPLFTRLAPFRSAALRDKLTDREKAVLDVYVAAALAGERMTGLTIAVRSQVKSGTLPYILDQLVRKGVLIRERKGVLPYLVGFKPPSVARPDPPVPPAAPQVANEVPAKPKRRFTDHAPLQPELVVGLPEHHLAIVEGRTLFPSTVVTAAESPRLLVSGENSRKIGDRVVKGPWRGMPIYTLTLEERATCPRSCAVYRQCYGNAMQLARRHVVDQAFFDKMGVELFELQRAHPDGFVVRLHILGDFPSPDYVAAWSIWLEDYPALRVFGYTAWPVDSEIGALIVTLREAQWSRFAVRTSGAQAQPCGATTIFRAPQEPRVAEGIVCPAQTGKTDCCGTCGLCWAEAARHETIAFIAHGKIGRAAAPPPALPAPKPDTVPAAAPFKAGPLPAKGQPASSFNNHRSAARVQRPPGAKVETVEEFLAKGGQVQKVQPGHAAGIGIGDGILGGVTVRPKSGYGG